MTINDNIEQLVFVIGAVVALSLAYSKGVATTQQYFTQSIIDAGRIEKRYRRITNLAVGVVLGLVVTLVGAMAIGTWEIVPAGLLAGVLASTEASRVHEQNETERAAKEIEKKRNTPPTIDLSVPPGTPPTRSNRYPY